MDAPSFRKVEAVRGECYHNVMHFVMANPEWSPVHGVPMGAGPLEGVRFGHAWAELEVDGMRWVYDPSVDRLLPAAIYYAAGCIEYAVVYERAAYRKLLVKHKHSGPWAKKILAAASKESTASAA